MGIVDDLLARLLHRGPTRDEAFDRFAGPLHRRRHASGDTGLPSNQPPPVQVRDSSQRRRRVVRPASQGRLAPGGAERRAPARRAKAER